MAEGVERILFIILGQRPYLMDDIEKFIAHVRNKLNLTPDHKPVVELHNL